MQDYRGATTGMTDHWQPGDNIILRTVHKNGRVGSVLPVLVVQDSNDLVALYLAPDTVCKRRAGARGGPRGRQMIGDTGMHEDWTWTGNRRLLLWRPHVGHAVSLFWRDTDDLFEGWYVDVLVPLRRSNVGFDTRDLTLDVVIDLDRTWHLKDEDELAWAVEHGSLTSHDVIAIRAEAARAVALLEANDPLFAESWVAWRPDPSWPIPSISMGWEVAQPL